MFASPTIKASRRKRNREELLASILTCARKGSRKTRIMYSCFLNFNQLQKYLKIAVEAGLLACEDDEKYRLTARGQQFLEQFGEVRRMERIVEEKRQMLNVLLDKR